MTSLLDAHANWRSRANELSHTLKISMFVGEYMHKHLSRPFLRQGAEPGARLLRAAYDEALARYDLLLMPTTPMKATPLAAARTRRSRSYCQRAFEMLPQHRALRLIGPSGHDRSRAACRQGLPVGMMLIGKH